MPDSRPDSDLRRTTVETEAADAELALAQAAMGIITWLWDLPASRVRWTGDLSPLLGQPAGSFSGSFPDFLQAMHPDDRIASSERFSACLRGQLPAYLAEERVIWPDGSVHWLETSGCATYGTDGRTLRMAGVIRDITERRHAQQELEGNEARLRRLIESSPVAIGMSRGDWVLSGNPAFLRLFGFADEAQATSRRVIDLVAPPARAEFTARTQRRKAGEAVESVYEVPMQRADDTPFPGLVSVSDAMLADGPAAVVFIQDLSETVRQRNALQHERDRAGPARAGTTLGPGQPRRPQHHREHQRDQRGPGRPGQAGRGRRPRVRHAASSTWVMNRFIRPSIIRLRSTAGCLPSRQPVTISS